MNCNINLKINNKTAVLKSEKATASVEMALILPMLITIVVAIFQIGIAYNNYISITHAAREGARLAAVGRYDETAVRAKAYPVNPTSIAISYPEGQKHGSPVLVTVKYDLLFSVPFFGKQTIPLMSRAEMRLEV